MTWVQLLGCCSSTGPDHIQGWKAPCCRGNLLLGLQARCQVAVWTELRLAVHVGTLLNVLVVVVSPAALLVGVVTRGFQPHCLCLLKVQGWHAATFVALDEQAWRVALLLVACVWLGNL